jgi:hypothetical protein
VLGVGVGVGVNRRDLGAKAVDGSGDATGDLAPVGDQDTAERRDFRPWSLWGVTRLRRPG